MKEAPGAEQRGKGAYRGRFGTWGAAESKAREARRGRPGGASAEKRRRNIPRREQHAQAEQQSPHLSQKARAFLYLWGGAGREHPCGEIIKPHEMFRLSQPRPAVKPPVGHGKPMMRFAMVTTTADREAPCGIYKIWIYIFFFVTTTADREAPCGMKVAAALPRFEGHNHGRP